MSNPTEDVEDLLLDLTEFSQALERIQTDEQKRQTDELEAKLHEVIHAYHQRHIDTLSAAVPSAALARTLANALKTALTEHYKVS